MAYSTGGATSHDNFFTSLDSFLTTNGWTQDIFNTTTNEGAWHKGTVYAQIRWDGTDNFTLFHSLGISGSIPGTNDSGNGDTGSAPHTAERRCNVVGTLSAATYYFFADGDYFHCALEVATGRFRHFGWGILDKEGDWTGGEYCYGHIWDQSAGNIDAPAASVHTVGLDSRNDGLTNQDCATVHIEGFPSQGGTSKWGVVTSLTAAGNDTAGVARVLLDGFMRDGPWPNAVLFIPANVNDGFVPMCFIEVYYRLESPSPDRYYLLGVQPDVMLINMKNINPGDEFSVGADTWKVFPTVRKQTLENNTEESWNGGIAYKKVP